MTTRLLHVAPELSGFARETGIADFVAGLGPALAARGHDVTITIPRRRRIAEQGLDAALARRLTKIPVTLGRDTFDVEVWEGTFHRCRLWLIDHAALEGDGARPAALFCKAALAVAHALDVWPDVVHAHDWQTGLVLLHAMTPPRDRLHPRRVLTIHDVAAQGIFPPTVIDELDLPRSGFHPDGYEYWGNVSLLKAGIVCAEAITTPSRRYAREILEHGHGFEGLMCALAKRTTGISSGIDDVAWSPSRDPHIARTYDRDTTWEKKRNKEALQHELKLPMRVDLPLVGAVARLRTQEGFDLVAAALPQLVRDGVQLVVHGHGELEGALKQLEREHGDRVRVVIGDDDALAHRIVAGSDLVLVPSRVEPCGVTQLHAQLYGAPPIVRATGGLADTVVDFDGRSGSGTGFTFVEASETSLAAAIRRALLVWRDDKAFTALQRRAMAQDFSWRVPAALYEKVYRG